MATLKQKLAAAKTSENLRNAGKKKPKSMGKVLKGAGSRALVKKLTPEEVKERLVFAAYRGDEPQELIEELETLIPKFGAGKTDKETGGRLREILQKAMEVYGLDTHFPLSKTVDKEYKPQVIEFSRQLIQEYDCKTSGEKALAETVVGAYARILKYSRCLNSVFAAGKSVQIDKQSTEFYLMLGKELDRANRHFITALTTLRQLKAPSLEINVKTQNAFVSQNQQINAVNNPNNKEDEIIDPK